MSPVAAVVIYSAGLVGLAPPSGAPARAALLAGALVALATTIVLGV